jgi:hypothetical protein
MTILSDDKVGRLLPPLEKKLNTIEAHEKCPLPVELLRDGRGI